MHPMLWLYRLVFLPLLLVIGPIHLWRARGRGGVQRAMGQRMGSLPQLPALPASKKRVWVQAVSVGEFLAAQPIIDELVADRGIEVVLTTTTVTSQEMAQRRYAGKVEWVGLFPVDFWPFMSRAWQRIRPDLMVLTESEWWPEHIHQAHRRGVPVLVMNARMSQRSFGRMRRLGRLVPSVLRGLTQLLAGSSLDAERFRALGFPADAVKVTGNIKVDIVINPMPDAERLALKAELGFGPEDIVLLGASTWPGEEETLLGVWKTVCAQAETPVRLLIVPRHAERRDSIETVVKASGARYALRSRPEQPDALDVCIADTTGELQCLTQVADIVFVGQSLPPHRDGPTPVEAAGLGRALIMGPGMANFRSIAEGLTESGAALRVSDATELEQAVTQLVRDPVERDRRARLGQAWHEANRGALKLTLAEIRSYLQR